MYPLVSNIARVVGCDIMAAQGTEGGGHTGGIASSVLLPMIVDICRNAKSELTGGRVMVMGAGGIFDGRGLATALSLGADAVWVGTRFICAEEAAAPPRHQKVVQTQIVYLHQSSSHHIHLHMH